MIFSPLVLFLSACTNNQLNVVEDVAVLDKVKSAKINTELGIKYLALGKLSLAKTKLDKAQNLAKIPETELALAWYFNQVKEFSIAQQHYMQALKLCQECTYIYQQYAIFLCEQKKCNEAYQYFALADVNYPLLGQVYTSAAICAQSCHNKQLAAEYSLKARNYKE